MRTHSEIASIAMTAIVTFVINFAFSWLSEEIENNRGIISVVEKIKIDNAFYTLVTIENFSDNFHNGLIVEIPASVATASLFSDTSLSINDFSSSGSDMTRNIEISKIPPNHIARLFVPISSNAESAVLQILNAKSIGFKIKSGNKVQASLPDFFWKIFLQSLIITVIFSLSYFVFITPIRREITHRVEHGEKEAAKNYAEIQRIKDRVQVLQNMNLKQRLLYEARIFDYSKELSFWRNTLKRMLVFRGGDLKDSNSVIKFISTELKTYQTQKMSTDYEAIFVTAEWIKNAERDSFQEKKRETEKEGKDQA